MRKIVVVRQPLAMGQLHLTVINYQSYTEGTREPRFANDMANGQIELSARTAIWDQISLSEIVIHARVMLGAPEVHKKG
jgi:hypothetical protein